MSNSKMKLSQYSNDNLSRLIARTEIDSKYEIHIGKKIIDFDCNDEIFYLSEPIGTKVISNNCVACEAEISKQKLQYCHFCGSRACLRCMYKQRAYQGQNSNGRKGLVCKICDRKFFMFATFSEYRGKMEAQQKLLNENELIANEKNQEYL